ncbi:MAG: hypothetical protein QMD13_10065 [Candidatus Bathyarchaeia archaeon]|nr:hypothetical protein [Candidatus Bathyarchaeia archaeon]
MKNPAFLTAIIFKQREDIRKHAEAFLAEEAGWNCGEKAGHRVAVEECGHMDYAVLGVRDLLEEMEKFDQQVYQQRKVHLIGVKTPHSKKVKLGGIFAVDPINRDLYVLADSITPL